MNVHIREGELKLLAFLHEHADGYTPDFQLIPGELSAALSVDWPQFEKDASYLASFGLVGMTTINTSSTAGNSHVFIGIWLTGDGENYMRELEAAPNVSRKLTVGVVTELWQMGKGAIVGTAAQVLAQFVRSG